MCNQLPPPKRILKFGLAQPSHFTAQTTINSNTQPTCASFPEMKELISNQKESNRGSAQSVDESPLHHAQLSYLQNHDFSKENKTSQQQQQPSVQGSSKCTTSFAKHQFNTSIHATPYKDDFDEWDEDLVNQFDASVQTAKSSQQTPPQNMIPLNPSIFCHVFVSMPVEKAVHQYTVNNIPAQYPAISPKVIKIAITNWVFIPLRSSNFWYAVVANFRDKRFEVMCPFQDIGIVEQDALLVVRNFRKVFKVLHSRSVRVEIYDMPTAMASFSKYSNQNDSGVFLLQILFSYNGKTHLNFKKDHAKPTRESLTYSMHTRGQRGCPT